MPKTKNKETEGGDLVLSQANYSLAKDMLNAGMYEKSRQLLSDMQEGLAEEEELEFRMMWALTTSLHAYQLFLTKEGDWKNGAVGLLQKASEVFFELGAGKELARTLVLLGSILTDLAPSIGLLTLTDGLLRLEESSLLEEAEYVRTQMKGIVEATILAVRVDYSARPHDEDIAFELGSCLLAGCYPTEAEYFLKGALKAYKMAPNSQKADELETRARWALAHAISYEHSRMEEAKDTAQEALEKAKELSFGLPWIFSPLGAHRPEVGEPKVDMDKYPALDFPLDLHRPYRDMGFAARIGQYGAFLIQRYPEHKEYLERAQTCLRLAYDICDEVGEFRHAASFAVALVEANLRLNPSTEVSTLVEYAVQHLVEGEDEAVLDYLKALVTTLYD